jgi:hypothetical protein
MISWSGHWRLITAIYSAMVAASVLAWLRIGSTTEIVMVASLTDEDS